MSGRLQWGIIGTGLIAGELADGIRESETGELLAVGSRSQETADAFGETHLVPRRYGSYQALLDDRDVEAVYIATPHPMHAEWTIKAAEAGKHILAEKPMGMNAPEARAMIDAAGKHDVFLMEAFMYRCHPQIRKVRELIADGEIGEVRCIRASFSYHAAFDPDHRAYSQALGGGGILDVGCYPVSLSRLIAGIAHGRCFENPVEVKGTGHLGTTGVDEYAAAVLRFEGDIVAEISCGIGLNMVEAWGAQIFGSEGALFIPNPWIPSRYDREPLNLVLQRHGDGTETIIVEAPKDLYTYEADMVAAHIDERQAPAMSWDDTLGNMETLDRWRGELGLVYEQEKPEKYTFTITRRPLAVRPSAGDAAGTPAMKYGSIPGLDKKVSRLVQGADWNHTMPYTAILFDEYFACGGNAFDTSHAYGRPTGVCEVSLGQWIRNRGIRDEVVVIEKGGNPPHGTPEGITAELCAGLERLQMNGVDIWMMHRDNPEVPVGEIIDVLNEHRHAGRCTVFGVSNWSLERLVEARAYCDRTGRSFFAALSNQLSLAEMVDNPFPGYSCLSCREDAFREWLAATGMPLLPWSSQGRGFFTAETERKKMDHPELARCFHSEQNFARRDRACELAVEKGVEPVNIALAWVLHQPFPTFPIVGPRRHSELWSSLRALDVDLTEEEMRRLDGPPPRTEP